MRLFQFAVIKAIIIAIALANILMRADASTPVNIAGDYLEYRLETEETVARGNAIIYQGNRRITADIVHADLVRDDVFAFGNAVLWQDKQKITADAITYNLKTGVGVLQGARLEQRGAIITAETLEIEPRWMRGTGISWTTCDREEHPDYRTTARKMEIEAGRKITMVDMKIWMGSKVVYRKKRYTQIEDDKKELPFGFKYGYSRADGVTFSISDDMDGFLGAKGRYNVQWRQRTSNTFRTSLERDLHAGKASLNYTGVQHDEGSMRSDITTGLTLNPERINRWMSGSLNMNLQSRMGYPDRQKADHDLSLRMSLDNDPVKKDVDIKLSLDRRLDLSGTASRSSLLEKSPELEMRHKTLRVNTRLGNIAFNPKITSGHYREYSRDGLFSGQRHLFELGTNWPVLRLGMTDFNLSTDGAWAYYSTGQIRSVYFTRGRFNVRPTDNVTSSFQAEERMVFGESPFSFDPQSKRKRLSVSHTWNATENLTIKPLAYSIDLFSHTASSLVSDISLKGDGQMNKWNLYLRSNYENVSALGMKKLLPDLKPSTYYMRWDLQPQRGIWRVNLSSNYNSKAGAWSDHNLTTRYRLGRRLTVGSTLRYDVANKRFSNNTHDFTYDMHCWEIKANWNATRKEFWIQSGLKAYPDQAQKLIYDIEKKSVKPIIPQLDFIDEFIEY